MVPGVKANQSLVGRDKGSSPEKSILGGKNGPLPLCGLGKRGGLDILGGKKKAWGGVGKSSGVWGQSGVSRSTCNGDNRTNLPMVTLGPREENSKKKNGVAGKARVANV